MVLGEIEEWKPNKGKGKKKAESGESQQGEGRRMHKGDMQEMVKNVMTRTRREKM